MSVASLPAGTIKQHLRAAEALCTQRGRRLTPIRRLVLEKLLQQTRGLKAYELLAQIRDTQPKAAPPTVYRALEFLVSQGLAHRLDAINAWAACLDAGGPSHDLLVVCTRCGAIAEIVNPRLADHIAQTVAETGFQLAGAETELRAVCQHCQA